MVTSRNMIQQSFLYFFEDDNTKQTLFYVIACVQSYGENCQHPCSQHCYNKECDRFNGTCFTGCTHGFHGQKCNKKGANVQFQTNLQCRMKYCILDV